MTNEEHNKYLAWAFIAHGSFQFLIMLLMMGILALALSMPGEPRDAPPEFLIIIFGFIFLFQTAFLAPSFVAAYALLKRKSWARIASIVAGVVSAMNVPFGTMSCVYALWFFLGENWKQVYQQENSAREFVTPRLAEDRESRWAGFHTNEEGEVVFRTVEPPDWR
jgi:hypothetical protein